MAAVPARQWSAFRWSALVCAAAMLVGLAPPVSSAAAAASTGAASAADAPRELTLGVFAPTLPLIVADRLGFFADEGLAVTFAQVTSSTQQFQSLRSGEYDLVLTSPDNVANYRLNTSNALGERLPVTGFAGSDAGMNLILTTVSDVTAPEELRGTSVAVDATDSGFAYVLYAILSEHGLERDTDYQVVSVGGIPLRFQALVAGEQQGALLSNGFEARAAAQGLRLFDDVRAVADPYLGTVFAALQPWLKQHKQAALAFTRAYLTALRWSLDPANREQALTLLTAALPDTGRTLAEEIYRVHLDSGIGLIQNGGISTAAMSNIVRLRDRFNGFDEPQNLRRLATEGGGLYTREFLRRAGADR
jgi:ABC-type nitrate/sulfonate/bicarbonate transport system substrate-binding protein